MSPVTTTTTSCYQAFWERRQDDDIEGWRWRQLQEASSADRSETTWSLNTDCTSLIHWAKCHNTHHNCTSPLYWTYNLCHRTLGRNFIYRTHQWAWEGHFTCILTVHIQTVQTNTFNLLNAKVVHNHVSVLVLGPPIPACYKCFCAPALLIQMKNLL